MSGSKEERLEKWAEIPSGYAVGFRCENMCKKREDFTLRNIDFEVKPGQILRVVGGCGVGKTVLLRTLMGSYRLQRDNGFDQGSISLAGYSSERNRKEYLARVGYVLQDLPFDPRSSAYDVGRLYGPDYPNFVPEEYEELLGRFEIPTRQKLRSLSAGQKTLVQFAFAMSCHPKLILLDEPAVCLDIDFCASVFDILRKRVREEASCVVITGAPDRGTEEIADLILGLNKDEEGAYQEFFGTVQEMRERSAQLECREEGEQTP